MKLKNLFLLLFPFVIQGCYANCTRYEERSVSQPSCRVFSGGYCQSMEYRTVKQRICVERDGKPINGSKGQSDKVCQKSVGIAQKVSLALNKNGNLHVGLDVAARTIKKPKDLLAFY